MAKSKSDSNQTEKFLLVVLSLISVGLLVAIVYVWSNALSKNSPTKPGDFLKTEPATTTTEAPATPSAGNAADSWPEPEVKPSESEVRLTINSPIDQEVVTNKALTVSGQTSAAANLTIVGAKEDVVSQADAAGAFSEKVTLDEGDNKITVTVFGSDGNQTSRTLTVFYIP